MTPFDCYKTYLALKNHFTKEKYDYHKYCGKSRASLQSFYKRKDRFWFEKLSRNKTDKEIVDFFVSNFVSKDNPDTLWIGEIIRSGDKTNSEWKKRTQSLNYLFKEETENLFKDHSLDQVFDCSRGHPIVLKSFLNGEVSIETLVIYNRIFEIGKQFDKKLNDPVWSLVSLKLRKYDHFLNINIFLYRKNLKSMLLGD